MQNQPESVLVELFRYNNWANAAVLSICQQLPADQLAASAPGAYGSIHRTLGHLVSAEADYIGRLTGHRPEPPFKWEDGPALPDIAVFAQKVGEAFLDVVQRVPPMQIIHEEEGNLFLDYQARVLYMQAIEHGIEHRTNVTTILSGLGMTLPELDIWGYMWTHQELFEVKEGTKVG